MERLQAGATLTEVLRQRDGELEREIQRLQQFRDVIQSLQNLGKTQSQPLNTVSIVKASPPRRYLFREIPPLPVASPDFALRLLEQRKALLGSIPSIQTSYSFGATVSLQDFASTGVLRYTGILLDPGLYGVAPPIGIQELPEGYYAVIRFHRDHTHPEDAYGQLRDSVDHPREGNQGMTYEDYRAELDFELRSQGPAYCADTLEGLAEQLHMDPKVFCASIEAYNQGLKSPKAPKNPFEMPEREAGNPSFEEDGPGLPPPPASPIVQGPFYAFLGQRFAEGAFGGVMTDEDMAVIRPDGSVIPGLYAVGDAASTWYTRGVLGPLTELTWAVNSGFLAGEYAAAKA